MATRRWIKVVATSFGVAALWAIAQFGVVDGLGIIEWSSSPDSAGETAWRGLLTWVVFLSATAVLGGAAAARRAIRNIHGPRVAVVVRTFAALSAGLGAAVALPLLWLSAEAVPPEIAADPELTLAISAGAGVAIGVALAVAALASAPIGVNLAATVSWVWLFALGSTALAYFQDGEHPGPRLGMIDAPQIVSRADLWFGPFVMIGIAGAFGFAVAAAGRWLSAPRLGVALSGFAGPAVVASAYLVAGLGGAEASSARLEPYVASLLAVTVGLLTSAVVSGAHRSKSTAVVSLPAARPIAAGRAPLAIEAAPAAAETKAVPGTGKRTSKRPLRAIAAKPHQSGGAATEAVPRQTERVLLTPGSEEDRSLRQSERDHISWMEKLVNTPADPELNSRRRS